ncbi:rhombosortase [Thalassotalea castellviae]|uniref:Rhombosortase n=1 Tax=Thalassotalea castellviae TaxID=3075612 RepID=A0ABU2ZWF4_9GAMM|nr:rhombosortase [Thalassotalea sp. W431]MDT0602259.1 rhombosortase [Thalassotalea sp. W431]
MFQLKKFPIQTTHLLAPLLLLIVALCCFVFNSQISETFIYKRSLIADHQYWRLFSGHVFHTNYAHLLLNTLAIILLWALHGQYYSTKQYFKLVFFSSIAISFGIYFFTPEMSEYVGLSGVLHALFVWGALKDIEHNEKTGYLLILGAIIKIIHEQWFGASEEIAQLIHANVAIDAHLWGAISGLSYYLLSYFSKKVEKKPALSD